MLQQEAKIKPVLELSTLSSIYLRYVPQIDVKTWKQKLSYKLKLGIDMTFQKFHGF